VNTPGLRVAVVGGGVAGIVSAHLASKNHQVTIFDKNDYLGGHTSTITIPSGPDAGTPVDTGFIVLNDKTYPNFHAFLEELNVPWRWSDMSFGFHSDLTGLNYAGTDFNGLFADRTNLLKPSFYWFLWEIKRFVSSALKSLESNELAGRTVGEFAIKNNLSESFLRNYLFPMAAAIWSSPTEDIRKFPAETLIHFFKNHGLLSFTDRPRWQTVIGGSRSYVDAFKKRFTGEIRLNSKIKCIKRTSSLAVVALEDGKEENFDLVVLAAHADEALKLLENPTPREKRLLSPWSYLKNLTILHTDTKVMPPNLRAWASWNFREERSFDSTLPVSMTYHMNRLQGLSVQNQYYVTLNTNMDLSPTSILREFNYTHPAYSLESVATQVELNATTFEDGVALVGSYFGYGFHEDAVKSAVRLKDAFIKNHR
jgi:predicted NAD/FAD-binding protein